MRWFGSLIFFLGVFSVNAAHVVVNSGQRIDGVEISASADGAVTLVTASGQKMIFCKGQYRRAVADKPRELAQAIKLEETGDWAEAEMLLKKIKVKYCFLSWDQKATEQLANLYFKQEKFTEAVMEFQSLENPDVTAQARLREAMAKSGNSSQVLTLLESDIASGSRAATAHAYLLRGDLRVANGDPDGAYRDWLKVTTFFKAQKEVVQQAEEKMKNYKTHENGENLSP